MMFWQPENFQLPEWSKFWWKRREVLPIPFNMLQTVKKKLQRYYTDDAPRLRLEGLQLFGDKMLAFRTELEVISEHFSEVTMQ